MGIENVPEKMTACQVIEFKQPYKIHEIPTPKELLPNDILVKVAVASFCHTDMMVQDGIMESELPCTASHEGTGYVAAVGSGVTKFKEGDRVMCGLFRDFCGVCAACQGPENYTQYCTKNRGAIGVHISGCFADYVVCDATPTQLLPPTVSHLTAAPLACAGITIWRGILQADLVKGQWIALIGAGGGLGHLGCQFAKALGLNVLAVDARDEGLALAKECGADVLIDIRKGQDKAVEEVHRVTNGQGADATVNISDHKTAAATACAVTKRHGTVVQIAQPETVDIPFAELVFRDIRIKGSLISSPEESKRMLEVVAEHGISVRTNVFKGINKIPELVELAHGGKMSGKAICVIDQAQLDAEDKNAK